MDMKRTSKKGINAVVWMTTLSLNGRLPEAEREPQMSEQTVVDRWIDGKWVSVTLTWNGSQYVEVR